MQQIEKLFIPTLGRANNQSTYKSIPDKFKPLVTFVICEKEKDLEFFKDKQCLITENNIGIAKTRKIIAENAVNIKYGVLDDDLQFLVRKEKCFKSTEKDFEDMLKLFSEWLNETNIAVCGMSPNWHPPRNSSFIENATILCNYFFDGNKLKVNQIDWDSIRVSEDVHVLMQIFSQGYSNRVSYKYFFNSSEFQNNGGCSTYRTLDLHNNSLLQLKRKFPKYIKLTKGFLNNENLNNQPILKSTFYFGKLYRDSQFKIKAKQLFS